MTASDRLTHGLGGRPFPPVDRDLAAYRQAAEPGPGPLPRAMLGLLLGAACGAVAMALVPRRPDAERGRAAS